MSEHCEYCGAALTKYWHKLTPVLVDSLIEAHKAVVRNNENHFEKADLQLSHSQYGNFQKLRFHGLIAKFKEDDGLGRKVWRRGHWLITKRGAAFLKGEEDIPYQVQTFRNRVVDHDSRNVNIKDVIGNVPYLESFADFERERATPGDLEQARLI